MARATVEDWTGKDVSIGAVEDALAGLRAASSQEGHPQQRTSVMTHVAWVPPEWLDAAERTLEGMAERHPSRTVILVPRPDRSGGIDADLSVRCFPLADRSVCGEVIELTLGGDRAQAPASVVLPLLVSDLPVFLRWRGEPELGGDRWNQLLGVADRLIVDSGEWHELRYAELVQDLERVAVSDLAWARTRAWRIELASRWPEIREQELEIRGPRAEASLLRGWLGARLKRTISPVKQADVLAVRLDGDEVALAPADASPSALLSAELDRLGRDPIYEEALDAAARA
jgi:glucose-6-phosphate dehydrogenase assembly protein OpcA